MIRISVIIASLNIDDSLIHTIDSCQKQIEVHLDLIISIKSRTDLIPRVVEDLSGNYPVSYIYYNDKGIADAWNISIKYASGDYFNFLGAGDLFIYPLSLNKLSLPYQQSDSEQTNTLVTYGKQLINCNRLRHSHIYFPGNEHRYIRSFMAIPHASSLWPKLLFKLTTFSIGYPISVDYDFLLRTHNLLSFRFVDFPIATILPGGLSNRPEKLLSVIIQDFKIKTSLGFNPFTGILLNIKRLLRWLFRI